MMIEVEKIVTDEFWELCKAFSLAICRVRDDEVVLSGKTFFFLLWFDRDGVSVKYVRLDGARFEAFDVGHYLLTKRGWTALGAPSDEGEIELLWRRDCSAYAFNLRKYATDILQGEIGWMEEIIQSPVGLSETMENEIKTALKSGV